MRLKLFVLLLCVSFYNEIQAQCVFGLEYEAEELNNSNGINETGNNDLLPLDFLIQSRHIEDFFGVYSVFRLYNEMNNSSAKALCKCNYGSCDNTVFIGKELISHYSNQFSKDGLWGIVAHELGHILQCRWGTQNVLNGVQRELHADFLAGYYLGVKMKVQLTNIRQFGEELFKRGDYNFNDANHHGTPNDRVQYMLMGASLSMLNLSDAYNYCLRYVTGNVGFFNINGVWRSNNNIAMNIPIILNVSTAYNQFYFQAINAYTNAPAGMVIAATQIGPNQYRLVWPSNSPFVPGITQDFIVINNNLILVMQSNGFVDILMR